MNSMHDVSTMAAKAGLPPTQVSVQVWNLCRPRRGSGETFDARLWQVLCHAVVSTIAGTKPGAFAVQLGSRLVEMQLRRNPDDAGPLTVVLADKLNLA